MPISTVLIIDDEADARNVLRRMLELFCPAVTSILEAKNSGEALRLARAQPIDLAFIDIELRGESGLELGLELRLICGKIAFVSGHEMHSLPPDLAKEADFLLKPVLPKQLEAIVAD